ncbi:MAG: 2TM domain-containing protein [Defluviitaleaceae bacterium]|nr:2TM domain-containing protein [Defluviitaleaceae bacterium]
MEPKVMLYDSNNVKIGETFARRARQLVKQQRAVWTNAEQTAVRFLAGMEHLKDTEEDTPRPEDVNAAYDAQLMKLARRRVVLKNVFRMMVTVYLLVNTFLVFIWLTVAGRGEFWPIWSIAGWGLALAIVKAAFTLASSPPNLYDTRVAEEYNRLKGSVGTRE